MEPPSFGLIKPSLGQSQAYCLLIAYCLVYVLPLYASAATRASPARSRDAPEAIRARIRAVSLSTTVCSVSTLLIIHRFAPVASLTFASASGYSTTGHRSQFPIHLMGYWPLGLPETAKAHLLTALLFAGPLYECLFIDGVWRRWPKLKPLRHVWLDWPTWRNIVAGPVTEECLFRSAAVPLLLLAGSDSTNIILRSPLVFGLAHLHHFYEFRITHPQTPLITAVARSVFQFLYTYIFGVYATFIFLRTGSLLAAISAHALCNSMGLPRLWGAVEPHWLFRRDLSAPPSPATWTALYYLLLVAGFALWYSNLYALTESPMALAVF
ncbi:CAAX protease self-immunity domain-containing protein [Hirsutella rhossiliensis]|uniref:intramembrane prenyl-peptidase Rce1 n=1 Tax=Hirsutella rhossiliensis TaxID=111463 RepID=A0A9P8MRS0_9HYPO|nr:CAAX protease self-immunity domain-containing protein [Hirsutella rhossiliensis]KAH0960070.1 CAAX protease self-immunity domain-containing protein [Hirsutella rhossiliensis]